MTTEYEDLMQKSKALADQAEAVRKESVAQTAKEILEKMSSLKMTAEDLGFMTPKTKRVKKVATTENATA